MEQINSERKEHKSKIKE